MAKVTISRAADSYLQSLIDVLYEEEYFGFREDAKAYVDAIYDFLHDLPNHIAKPSPIPELSRWYCRFEANRNTTWFVCFDRQGEDYLVRAVFNNHSATYALFR